MEIRSQTGLRGIAAVVVAAGHLPLNKFSSNLHESYSWLLCGPQAVELFFMLSGYILAYVYLGEVDAGKSRSINWKSFHISRFARIYPLHLLTTLIVGVLAFFMSSGGMVDESNYQLWHLFSQLFQVHAYPYIGMEWPWNYPSWSISIEYFCYLLVFPLCIFLFRKSLFSRPAINVVLVALLMCANVYQLVFLLPEGVKSTTGWPAIARGFCSFSAGFLVYVISKQSRAIGSWFIRNATLVTLVNVGVLVMLCLGSFSKWFVILFFPMLLMSFSADGKSLVHRFLACRIVHYLGLISYSLYLWHAIYSKCVGTVIRNFEFPDVNNTLVGFALYVAIISGIIVTSSISYHFFELPAKRGILRFFRGRSR